MKQLFFTVAILAFVIGVLVSGDALASTSPSLGDGCYVIPTQSTLVKVLVGAQEKDEVLIAPLTTGEMWFLRAFFDMTPVLSENPDDLSLCFPSTE